MTSCLCHLFLPNHGQARSNPDRPDRRRYLLFGRIRKSAQSTSDFNDARFAPNPCAHVREFRRHFLLTHRKCMVYTYTVQMFLTIDTTDPRPIYQQVADGIKELVARGKLVEGTSLPPVRQLAADLGVNLNTIATAYRELQKDGLIAVKHGSGSVVASRTSIERSQDELLRPLRTALTELVLAGLSSSKILSMVSRELSMVEKESK
jgi:GntR family transcriptional regulator